MAPKCYRTPLECDKTVENQAGSGRRLLHSLADGSRTLGWLSIAVTGCRDRERPGSFAVDTIAVPPPRVAVPSVVVPCLNVTMPVGPPGALDTNLATNLTVCSEAEGFGLEVTVVVEA
jgi:hypothetical protein